MGSRSGGEIKNLIHDAKQAGWTVVRSRRNLHYQFRSPSGALVIVPSTPSEYRSLRNTAAVLRRAGLDVRVRS